jgi:uncharacterized protein YkwD
MKNHWFTSIGFTFSSVIIAVTLVSLNGGSARTRLSDGAVYQGVYLPLMIFGQPPPPTCQPFPVVPPDDSFKEDYTNQGLNHQRANNGLPALIVLPELTQAARLHSRDMADHNFTSHTGSDGSDGGQRMEAACYTGSGWGEIIGWGFDGDYNHMISWWMNSLPHQAIILNDYFDVFGTGFAENSNSEWKYYWTVNFGRISEPVNDPTAFESLHTCTYLQEGPEGGSLITLYISQPCP